MDNKGKQKKFLALYEPVHNRFERFCRARVFGHMDPRDLMNDALLVAYEKFDHLRSADAFLSFLIGISVRLLANNYRKKTEERLPVDGPDVVDSTVLPQSDPNVQLLHQALALLPDAQRECIVLFEISGFSIKEVAAIQQASGSAVKQRLRRGRERLAVLLNVERTKTGEEAKHHES